MSDAAERFEADNSAFSGVRLAESGEYLHEYTGVLAETDERVRIFTLPPELTDIHAAVNAFTRVSDQWYNASANATIVAIRERGTEPYPWIAVPDTGRELLATLQPKLSTDTIETVITETADALRTLGLYNTVHGYLSPDDIYLTGAGGETAAMAVELGGFGLEAAIQAAVGEFTPTAYTAPELLDNPTQPTEQTDVYGLAAVTYFALTGHPPIEDAELDQAIRNGPAASPSTYVDAIPGDLDDVVIQALSTRPDGRYDSPYAFSRAFVSTFSPDEISPGDTAEENDGETEVAEVSAETAGSDEANDTEPSEADDSAAVSGGNDSSESNDRDSEKRVEEMDKTAGSGAKQTRTTLVVAALIASGLSLTGSIVTAGGGGQNLAIATVLFILGVGTLAVGLVIALYGVKL